MIQRLVVLLVSCLIFGSVRPAAAQLTTADIVGTVTDSTGGVVPGVTVTVVNTATEATQVAVTDGSGNFVVNLLPPGRYRVRVELEGFRGVVREIPVGAGDRSRVDARLETGQLSETITVTAEAPLLQTDTSTVGATITAKAVADLPLNGRNYIELVRLQPGVNVGAPNGLTSGTRPDARRQGSSFSANGQPEGANEMLLDGLENNVGAGLLAVRPSVEGIAEVKVSTNVFTAEVGRTQGAVVNVITKSGGNQFRGSLFEFHHDDRFDGNDYFAKRANRPKGPLTQNQFGWSLGGPLVKNRTFFFADMEWLRLRQQLRPVTSTVPTAYELDRPGDFSDRGGPVLAPGQIHPLGLALFRLYPRPTPGQGTQPSLRGEPTVNNFIYAPTKTQRGLTGDIRIDQNFSGNDRIYGRFSYNPVKTSTPGVLPSATTTGGIVLEAVGGDALSTDVAFPGNNDEAARSLALNYVHVFGQSVLEVRGGQTLLNVESLPPNYGSKVGEQLGFKNAVLDEFSTSLTSIRPAGYTQLGDPQFLPIINRNDIRQAAAAVTTTRGSHNVKIGAAVVRRYRNVLQNPEGMGTMTFGTSAPGSMVAMLQGQPLVISRRNQPAMFHFRWWEPSVYVQDDWRVNSRLTVNVGLRYEVFTPQTERDNRLSNFDLDARAFRVASKDDPLAGVGIDWLNVAPRLGFAAELAENTVMRGGYGISYSPADPSATGAIFSSTFSCTVGNPGAIGCVAPYGSIDQLPPLTLASPTNLGGTLALAPDKTITPYTHQFNVFLQKQLGANVASVGYVGQRGRRINRVVNLNRPVPSTVAGVLNPLTYASVLPTTQALNITRYEGLADYNSMQLVFERRFSTGLSVNSNYTLAYSNNTQGGQGLQAPDGTPISGPVGLLPNDVRYDYGPADVDVRHRVAFGTTYVLPFGRDRQGILPMLVKDWQVNLVGGFQSGMPITVVDAAFGAVARINVNGVNTDRPNQLRSPRLDNPTVDQWFDITAFAPQSLGTPGNAKRNSVRGPGYKKVDMSFFKDVPMGGRMTAQARVEVFNLFDWPFFSLPIATFRQLQHTDGRPVTAAELATLRTTAVTPADIVASPAGGVGAITTTQPGSAPRQVQFGFKLTF
jgi:hypothetical protein